jgi:hypothetical protein
MRAMMSRISISPCAMWASLTVRSLPQRFALLLIDNEPLVVLGREIHDLSELGTGHANASGYHCGRGRIPAMPDNDNPPPSQPFFLIVADYDRGFFTVEGPMTDDGPWNDLARYVPRSSPVPRCVRADRSGS